MCPSAPRVCSEPGGQKPVLSLSLDYIRVIPCGCWCPGACLNIKMPCYQNRNSHYQIRQPHDHLIFYPIPWKTVFIFKQGPGSLRCWDIGNNGIVYIHKLNGYLSSTWKDFNYMCHLSMEKLWEIHIYISNNKFSIIGGNLGKISTEYWSNIIKPQVVALVTMVTLVTMNYWPWEIL